MFLQARKQGEKGDRGTAVWMPKEEEVLLLPGNLLFPYLPSREGCTTLCKALCKTERLLVSSIPKPWWASDWPTA